MIHSSPSSFHSFVPPPVFLFDNMTVSMPPNNKFNTLRLILLCVVSAHCVFLMWLTTNLYRSSSRYGNATTSKTTTMTRRSKYPNATTMTTTAPTTAAQKQQQQQQQLLLPKPPQRHAMKLVICTRVR